MDTIECAEIIEVLTGLFQYDDFNPSDRKKIKTLIMKLVDIGDKNIVKSK